MKLEIYSPRQYWRLGGGAALSQVHPYPSAPAEVPPEVLHQDSFSLFLIKYFLKSYIRK